MTTSAFIQSSEETRSQVQCGRHQPQSHSTNIRSRLFYNEPPPTQVRSDIKMRWGETVDNADAAPEPTARPASPQAAHNPPPDPEPTSKPSPPPVTTPPASSMPPSPASLPPASHPASTPSTSPMPGATSRRCDTPPCRSSPSPALPTRNSRGHPSHPHCARNVDLPDRSEQNQVRSLEPQARNRPPQHARVVTPLRSVLLGRSPVAHCRPTPSRRCGARRRHCRTRQRRRCPAASGEPAPSPILRSRGKLPETGWPSTASPHQAHAPAVISAESGSERLQYNQTSTRIRGHHR